MKHLICKLKSKAVMTALLFSLQMRCFMDVPPYSKWYVTE